MHGNLYLRNGGELKNKVKKYLKTKNKYEIKEIVNHPDLSEIEKWLIYYTYGEDRYVLNTCAKLNISERHFYNIQDVALTKLYYILNL